VKNEKVSRPVCIECGSKWVISSGISWHCGDCGRVFKKHLRGRPRLKVVRPNCPKCGAEGEKYTISCGQQWKCSKCSRSWLKFLIGTNRTVEGDRPNCPTCGKSDPMSKADRWKCTGCSLTWQKNYRTSKVYSPLDLHSAKVVDV